MKLKKTYSTEILPFNENLASFAPVYTPEPFTKAEKQYLAPFFSNIDKPYFVVNNLPEEVIGALSSRYSRSVHSLRRMFINEYINPIVKPEEQKDWGEKSPKEKRDSQRLKEEFIQTISYLNKTGGVESVVNVQRGRKFFDKWLAAYGDDSIAEMGGVHVCLEGISNIAVKEVEDKRIGISPLEKSSRYVSFREKRRDGEYQYIIPGEIRGTKYEKGYKEAMDQLFDVYNDISEPYLEYIKTIYPEGADETPTSFHNSRGAKRFDDIRDLLPFATQTNVALFGNGRAFEDVINRLLAHPLGELRWWGQALAEELERVVPSFVRRPKTERGAESQYYRRNLQLLRNDILKSIAPPKPRLSFPRWVKLLRSTKNAETEILAAYLIQNGSGYSLHELRRAVQKIPLKKRAQYMELILKERVFGQKETVRQVVRFRKVPRAFENAHYLFEVWARGGDYRDLQRHRQMTQERHLFTTKFGYDLEREVLESPFISRIEDALHKAEQIFIKLEKVSPWVAQYAVPYGHIQHWYMHMTAREIYWIVELRTGPQGRPHYRAICQQIAREAKKASPSVFSALLVDTNEYSLARRESEKKIEKKLKKL